MTRAVILVEQGFQDEEFVFPYYRMLEEGWRVDIASPDGAARTGKYGVPARVNRIVGNLAPEEYDVVLIPGGFECPDRLRVSEPTIAFVRAMHAAGKLVAAICHAPWVLVSAGLCPGRRMTGYKSIKADLMNAGAIFEDSPVVEDRNIITAPHYRENGPFMRAVVQHVNTQRRDQFTEGAHAI
jgi:protease I